MGQKIIVALSLLLFARGAAQGQGVPGGAGAHGGAGIAPLHGVPVHDPVMIRQDSTYYVFCTGMGISVWSSPDRMHWHKESPVFPQPPAWAGQLVPGYRGHTWAPDISFYQGAYYLFYAVSTFGKNNSAIGLAVNKTLHADAPGFHWDDRGMVIHSIPGRDLWNAIDPNLAVDSAGQPWLTFGSFWEGIKLVRLRPDLGGPAVPERWYTLASRGRDAGLADTLAGNGAIEAPFIVHHGDWYYLFVSFDYCCRGAASNYRVMVGRSHTIYGPYADREGVPMTQGGGTPVVQGDERWHGAGHNAVCTFDGVDYILYHAYDATQRGVSLLRIDRLRWDGAQWPVADTSGTAERLPVTY